MKLNTHSKTLIIDNGDKEEKDSAWRLLVFLMTRLALRLA